MLLTKSSLEIILQEGEGQKIEFKKSMAELDKVVQTLLYAA